MLIASERVKNGCSASSSRLQRRCASTPLIGSPTGSTRSFMEMAKDGDLKTKLYAAMSGAAEGHRRILHNLKLKSSETA